MDEQRFLRAVRLIDQANAQDPEGELWQGQWYPKTYLYGLRMTAWLTRLEPKAPEEVFLAARAQHLCRWLVPRQSYPPGREGYLKWRTFLYKFHADKAAHLLAAAGYGEEQIACVRKILLKRGLKQDPKVQRVEDAACLVFLEYYFAPFIQAVSDDKAVEIVAKIWRKLSDQARQAALGLHLAGRAGSLFKRALNT
jgi:hypothetical protein